MWHIKVGIWCLACLYVLEVVFKYLMMAVDLAWICRIVAVCIPWCKCRIPFLLVFLRNEIGWFLKLWARLWLRRPRILHCFHRWLHCCLLDVWWIIPNVELLLQRKWSFLKFEFWWEFRWCFLELNLDVTVVHAMYRDYLKKG